MLSVLVIVVAIFFYAIITFQQEKIIKELRSRQKCTTESRPRVSSNNNLLYADRSIALGGIYTTPETRSYYRSATIPERRWQKVGVLTGDNDTLNLYARPSTYNEDIWQYQIEDKDGFFVDIGEMQNLKNGSTIENIPGKSSVGVWKANIYKRDSYYF